MTRTFWQCRPGRFAMLVLLSLASAVASAKGGRSFNLDHWCEKQSRHYYLSRGITPYNWSASMIRAGDALFVRGRWSIGREVNDVNCRVVKGAPKRFAVLEIPSQSFVRQARKSRHVIRNQKQLRRWCKFRTSQHLLQRAEVALYSWVTLPTTKSDKLTVRGQWTVDQSRKRFRCSVYKDSAEEYATMEPE